MKFETPNSAQVQTMLNLQHKLNTIVDAEWIIKKFPYLRAAFVESAEALDHYGWKWWKQQTPNIPQVQIEISDILHFYLSDILLSANGDITTAQAIMLRECQEATKIVIVGQNSYKLAETDTPTLFELLAATSILRQRSLPIFQELMQRNHLDWSSLYTAYVSKNILNIFRQSNGYKEGTYIKIWDGLEDNEHLHDIMSKLDSSAKNFSQLILDALTDKYSKAK
jgi:hypothetical protein